MSSAPEFFPQEKKLAQIDLKTFMLKKKKDRSKTLVAFLSVFDLEFYPSV